MSLIEHLKQVRDFRTQPRYELWVILLLILMGVLSGCTSYRALEEFVGRHQAALLELLKLPYTRLPSYSTLRKVIERVPFESLTRAFNAWAITQIDLQSGEQLAIDGKGIKASVVAYDTHLQDFVNVVSAFSVRTGVVVGLMPMHNAQQSEIETVLQLLEILDIQGVCFSFDALHTQKNSGANH
ncbi:mobile element protein [Leptolyngbya sp. NIES-2104]|uniref:ISAs1 family transposase n=1 Tax=Leptolyngbya sp. NIES-2104 TaxID=1552121 RepID=UPI0006EC97CD|nr:ISAs1 family transposase [Leptolyngbya sp. NIES-2104]GAP98037.1 mobile element protein [Leptolyngbya sp. NIES-2104]